MNVFPWQKNGNGERSHLPSILLEYDPEQGPSDGNNKKYRRSPAHYDDPTWHLGWTDGRLGQSEEASEKVLRAQVHVERQEEIRKARELAAAARAKVETLRPRLELALKEVTYAHSYYMRLWAERDKQSSRSSIPLGLMYLVFGLALFLADVPLSLQLVAQGFKIPTRKTLLSGEKVGVDMFFTDWWLVLSNLAEPLFLALGIALMGIVVKFFLDTIVFRDEDDPPLNRTTQVAMYVAFALFVGSTISLGMFRSEIMRNIHGSILNYEVLTFICLTLTFPLAGGLCFSAGWRRLERARHFYFTRMRLRRVEQRHDAIAAEFNEQSELVKSLEEALDREGEDLTSSRVELRRNLYLHGYYRGRNVPETLDAGESLYGFCQRALRRALARKVRRKLQLTP